jgi:phosphatidylserine/phosphatidylglycerophosphate/cardiolipin synthase-like enzyme
VTRESSEALDQFDAALRDRRIGLSPTLGTLQDALAIDNARARAFRGVLQARGERSVGDVVDCLRAARGAAEHAREDVPLVEIAWTHPGPVLPAARTTGAVARDVISGARRSLLVVGYSVTVDANLAGLAAQTVGAMGRAASRGVVVTAILHRDGRNREALLRGWPAGRALPGLFTWPEREGDEMASLHAKVLVADASDALVTSANLTYHGYEANVEVGVRITGDGARELEAAFHELIRVRDFVSWAM